jgi:hypothetical protein
VEHYVVTGHDLERDEWVSIDVLQNSVPDDHAEDLRLFGDYDSLLGFSNDVPYIIDAMISPIPNTKHSLTTSVHLFRSLTREDGTVSEKSTTGNGSLTADRRRWSPWLLTRFPTSPM